MSSSHPVEIDCKVKRETAMAYLINTADKEVWVPKSQVSDIGYEADGRTVYSLFIPEWLATEKGLV